MTDIRRDRRKTQFPKTGQVKVRILDAFTYEQKIDHWGHELDPWKPESGRYFFSNPSFGERSPTMIEGHITGIPFFAGRPCFGILTAFLRYRDSVKYVPGRGWQPASRCGNCAAFKQCETVVDRRIKAAPALKAAYDQWLLADGPREIVRDGWRERRVGRLWKELCRVARANPFKSSNDDRILEHYAQLDRELLNKDRDRQAKLRERARKAGEIDEQHEKDLQQAQIRRARRLVDAVVEAKQKGSPRTLSRLPSQSVRETLEVWLGRELLRARKQKPTAAAIARWIEDTGLSNSAATPNALAARVSKDLRRIDSLEHMMRNGEPILPPFDSATEFTYRRTP